MEPLERYPEPAFCFTPDAEFPLICGEKGVYHGEFTSAAIAGEKIVELDGGTVPNAIPGLACALVRADAATLPQAPHIDIEDAGVDDQGNHLTRISAHGKGGHASMSLETVNAIGLLDAITTLEDQEHVLFLVDLWGGTPFNQISRVLEEEGKEDWVLSLNRNIL